MRIGPLLFGDYFILFLPSFIFNTNRKYKTSIIGENTLLPTLKEFLQVGITFVSVTIGWVFFRSETIGDSLNYLIQMIFQIDIPYHSRFNLLLIFSFLPAEYLVRKNERLDNIKFPLDWVLYSFLIVYILENFSNHSNFIYFQF